MTFPKSSWLHAEELYPPECIQGGPYLPEQGALVLLQLLLEPGVGAGIGAHGPGGSQAALPAQLCHRHQVSHQHRGAAGHPRQAGMEQERRQGERIPQGSPPGWRFPLWSVSRVREGIRSCLTLSALLSAPCPLLKAVPHFGCSGEQCKDHP